MANLKCLQFLVVAVDAAAMAHQCQNALRETPCHIKVMGAMLDLQQNSATAKSTFAQIQAYFHDASMHGCPRPCRSQEEPCVKFGRDYPGMHDVNSAKERISKYPQLYPELSHPASDKQIAGVLYKHGVESCPRPCDDDEEQGHYVSLTSTTATTTNTRSSTVTTTGSQTSTNTETSTTRTITISSTKSSTNTVTTFTSVTSTSMTLTQSVIRWIPVSPPIVPPNTESTIANRCFTTGKSFSPLDAVGHTPVFTESVDECQAHCRSSEFTDIGQFLYHEPIDLCHCPPWAAFEAPVGPEFISGPLVCDTLLDDVQSGVPAFVFNVSGVPVMTAVVASVVLASAAFFAVRRQRPARARTFLLGAEVAGLEFRRTWPNSDSAVE
eukprot:TRINITY_DN35549_c0_g1_i1.p1 TRINITY_DN35549_c0_g1~~TRINITY_DN35549_c0_g1_i1.p1  ORF type:complete len:382 (-),score=46.10 TRINITY_DN35549_c0_g1_i1:63-1208(-)